MLYTSLAEIKRLMQVDPEDTSEDWLLTCYNEWTTNILEELLNRDFTLKVRTVVYPGTGTQKLLLKHRPLYGQALPAKVSSQPFTAISVIIDEAANFGFAPGAFGNDGSNTLVFGTDYTYRPDMDDGGSREAILYRVNQVWPKPFIREPGVLSPSLGPDLGSVQVTYTAGYTIDTLPAVIRAAANLLVTRLSYLFPLGMALSAESFVDRNISLSEERKGYLMGLVKPLVISFMRNHYW